MTDRRGGVREKPGRFGAKTATAPTRTLGAWKFFRKEGGS